MRLLAFLALIGCASGAAKQGEEQVEVDTSPSVDTCPGNPEQVATGPIVWFADVDGDGYGDPAVTETACTAPEGYVPNDEDCDDTNAGQPDAERSCQAPYVTTFGSRMLAMPAGSFTMAAGRGDPDGYYIDHDVTLTRSFWLGEHELTHAEWDAWADAPEPAPYSFVGDELPVEGVSWRDAAEYANGLSAAEGLTSCYESDGSDVLEEWRTDPASCPADVST